MNIDYVLFFKAFITGIVTSMPSGPITFFALHRIMEKGKRSGFAAGMGSASADAIFAFIASLGVMQIDQFLKDNQFWVRIISAVVLTLLGIRILKKSDFEVKTKTPKLHHEFRNTFLLAIINPPTIFVFLQIFILFHMSISASNRVMDVTTVVIGILLGSTAWWIGMTYLISHFKKFVSEKFQRNIRKASGVMMILMAFFALLNFLV